MTRAPSIELRPTPRPLSDGEREARLSNLSFGRVFTEHMITIPYTEEGGWGDTGPAELVDDATLAGLRQLAGEEQVGELLRIGMRGYEDYCDRMQAPGVTAEAMLRDAHRLKGSSGTLGFAAISRLAGVIEEAAARGETPRDLVPPLRAAMEATREELGRRGLLQEAV